MTRGKVDTVEGVLLIILSIVGAAIMYDVANYGRLGPPNDTFYRE